MAGRLSLLIIIAALAGLALGACRPSTGVRPPCPAGKLCLEYGNGADPISLDPALLQATVEAAVDRELIEGLLADGQDGAPVPGVAERWQTSPDGLVWTFHLRPEVWSDGVPVTANDFVYAYRRILDPKTASSYAYLVYVLKNGQQVNSGKAPLEAVGAKALDDHTLQLTLEHPAPYLLELLKHSAFYPVPQHVVERWQDTWTKQGHFVGNGPFRLVAWRLSDYLRIEKNPLYYDAAKVCFDQVTFYPTNDVVSAERRVLRGEMDVNNGIQSNRVKFLRGRAQSAPFVHSHPYLATYYVIFNQRDVAPLKDGRVRQALSMAIDRTFITDKLLGAGQVPTTAFVPAIITGYLAAGARRPAPYWAAWSLSRRQAEARRLLAAAGYGPARPLKLELKMSNSPGAQLVPEALQADWKNIGVQVGERPEDGIIVFQSYDIRDFQLGMAGWVADFNDPLTFLGLMKSDTGAQNYGDYKNAAYDALLGKADHEVSAVARANYLAQAEQMVLDDADIAPLYNSVNLSLVNHHITGWTDNAEDIHPIRYLCRDDAARGAAPPPP
jgi:oligopeptide transport system substrate-binding protein